VRQAGQGKSTKFPRAWTGYKTLHIPKAQNGMYQLNVTGTGAGTFSLTHYFVASDGSRQVSAFSGVTDVGVT
jgi:hypothetical protein